MSSANSTATTIGIKLLEISVLILPLWLAALRYLVNQANSERTDWKRLSIYSLTMVLGYASLQAAMTAASTYLVDTVNRDIAIGLLFMHGFGILVGAAGVNWLLEELSKGRDELEEEFVWERFGITEAWVIPYLQYIVYAFMVIFIVLVLLAFRLTLL